MKVVGFSPVAITPRSLFATPVQSVQRQSPTSILKKQQSVENAINIINSHKKTLTDMKRQLENVEENESKIGTKIAAEAGREVELDKEYEDGRDALEAKRQEYNTFLKLKYEDINAEMWQRWRADIQQIDAQLKNGETNYQVCFWRWLFLVK